MKLIFLSLLCPCVFLFTSCQKDHEIPANQIPLADAGSAQTIQSPGDSVNLKGEGKDNDGQVVGYIWNQLSGPNSANIVNNGAPATIVRNLTTGIYLFQLAVVDNDGATGVDTVSVTVNPSAMVLLTLQPNQNPTEVHIYGNSNNIDGTYPPSTEIGAASWTDQGSQIGMRALLKFDLSSIPPGAKIKSAKLTLYSNPTPINGDLVHANSGTDNTILIERVTSPWDANSVKWINQPIATPNNQIIIPHTAERYLDLVDLDVSELARAMISGDSNYGFFIRLQTENIYNSRIFCSSKYSDASKHPKLIIEYNQ